MKTMIAGLLITFTAALLPAPSITVRNPQLLYAAAMYKTALGDTESALRLMHRAEQAEQSTPAAHPNSSQTACDRSSILTNL